MYTTSHDRAEGRCVSTSPGSTPRAASPPRSPPASVSGHRWRPSTSPPTARPFGPSFHGGLCFSDPRFSARRSRRRYLTPTRASYSWPT